MVTTPEQRRVFQNNGYIALPEMFSLKEVEVVIRDLADLKTRQLVADARGRNKGSMAVEDNETPRLQFDIHKTDSRLALMCRHPRVAGLMQELMELPLYVYHSKLSFKAPFVGSVQYWHQDFGYWKVSHRQSTMGSCLVMLDKHTEDNGCMQVLAGSHRGGVVEHRYEPRESTGDNQLAIPSAAMRSHSQRYNRVKLIGNPGTVVAWHSNTMHASSHNVSENPRRALIVAFNAIGNSDENLVKDSPYTAHRTRPVELSSDECLS